MKEELNSLFKGIFDHHISVDLKRKLALNLKKKYPQGTDPFNFNPNTGLKYIDLFHFLYSKYFQVRVYGAENITNKQYIVVANHSGQIAFDAFLVSIAFLTDLRAPLPLRPMMDRFVIKMPFIGSWISELGGVLGDRKNCNYLLSRGESILVFPEGVKGIAKSTFEYYKLKPFSKGFFRIALSSKVEILPVAVVGAEEFYPYVYQLKSLSALLGIPTLPLSPNLLFGPLGLLPLPSPVDIYIGKPYPLPKNLSMEAPESHIIPHVDRIMKRINKMIIKGRKVQRPISFPFFSKFLK